jgi:hypothetical protein
MKMTLLKISGLLALAALVTLAIHDYRQERNRHAIIKVLQERLTARNDNIIARSDGRKTLHLRRVMCQLRHIDPTDCPAEFQTAWLDYIQALERFATPSIAELQERRLLASATSCSLQGNLEGHAGFQSGLGGGLGLWYAVAHESYPALAQLYAREDPSEAFRHVESVALKYKVNAPEYE